MNRDVYKLIMFFIIILVVAFNAGLAQAHSMHIPGDTDEEVTINREILESDDEYFVFTYLDDPAASIRMTACMRLQEIGTSYSLSTLEGIATDYEEGFRVRDEAALALWKIRYREAISRGGAGEGILLSAIGLYTTVIYDEYISFEISPISFTPIPGDPGSWEITRDPANAEQENVYKQSSTGNIACKSIMDGMDFYDGYISVFIKTAPGTGCWQVFFGMDEECNNGYVMHLQCEDDGDGPFYWLGLFKLDGTGAIDFNDWSMGSTLNGGTVFDSFDSDRPHTLRLEVNGTSIAVFMNGAKIDLFDESGAMIDGASQAPDYTHGRVALGTEDLSNSESWFDDVSVQGSRTFRDDSDITKIPRVKGWAMELLGDMGSEAAEPLLEAIRDDTEFSPYSSYLKKIAEENLTKITFLTSFDPDTPLSTIIFAGLSHEELCVRKWALRALVELDQPNLMDTLEVLFQQAHANQDDEFASYIAEALEVEKEKNRYPAIEFEYPQDGATLKTPYANIFGYTYGEPFYEAIDLVPGPNTYTKEVIDRYGNPISEIITIHFENEPPVLDPIGDKEVLVGQTLTFTVSASDPDDTDLLYFAYDLPERASFDYQTHTFLWTPAEIGSYSITFEVDDGYGLTDEEEVTIRVKSGLEPDIERIEPVEGTPGDEIHIHGSNFGTYTGDPDYNPDVDLDYSGKIDFGDFNILANCYGLSTDHPDCNPEADFNDSGRIDFGDFNTLANIYGTNCGTSYVEFSNAEFPNGIKAHVYRDDWSDGEITCKVPTPLEHGEVVVVVVTEEGRSEGFYFTVINTKPH